MIVSDGSSSAKVNDILTSVMDNLEGPPSLILCGSSISADFDGLETAIQSGVPFHGASSCLGVMTNQGPFVDGGVGAGILAISDPTGAYGSAVVPIEADEVEAAARAAL